MKIRKINQSAGVVANVTSSLDSTSEVDALSASAGKELKDLINSKYIPKMTAEATLNTAGWYRIAKISDLGQMGKSLILNINTRYGQTSNVSASILINIAYLKYNMTLLSSAVRFQAISKVRLVNDNDQIYIEVYYNDSKPNIVGISILNQRYNTGYETDLLMLGFESPVDTATILSELTIEETDTGWVTLNEQISYRKIGNVVSVKGEGNLTIGNGYYTTIGTLPSNIRPPKYLYFAWSGVGADTSGQAGKIDNDGTIQLYLPTGKTISTWGFYLTYIR